MKNIMRSKKALSVSLFVVCISLFVGFVFIGSEAKAAESIIACGKTKDTMCTLCDIIKTIHTVIDYLMKIAIAIALAVFTAAGIMYIVSAGGSTMINMAKSAMTNALIGFIVLFCAFLIIDGIVIPALGANKDLGIGVTGWGKFDCTANKGVGGQ
jgi:hypothetical protein